MYSWSDVAERTEKVYYAILRERECTLMERFLKYNGCGLLSGKISCIIVAMNYIFLWILDRMMGPSHPAPTFDLATITDLVDEYQ